MYQWNNFITIFFLLYFNRLPFVIALSLSTKSNYIQKMSVDTVYDSILGYCLNYDCQQMVYSFQRISRIPLNVSLSVSAVFSAYFISLVNLRKHCFGYKILVYENIDTLSVYPYSLASGFGILYFLSSWIYLLLFLVVAERLVIRLLL